jgi:hypothetical protein
MAEYRQGFCVEKVTSGCKCQPLSVYESDYMGADDFHNMTEGLGLHGVGGDLDNEGACPKCHHPVRYHRYLVVTEVPPEKPVQTELERELLLALKNAMRHGGMPECFCDKDDPTYKCNGCFARAAINKAEGKGE